MNHLSGLWGTRAASECLVPGPWGFALGIMGWSVSARCRDGWGCGLCIGWSAFEEHMLQSECFTDSGNWLTLAGTVPPRSARPWMSKQQKRKVEMPLSLTPACVLSLRPLLMPRSCCAH